MCMKFKSHKTGDKQFTSLRRSTHGKTETTVVVIVVNMLSNRVVCHPNNNNKCANPKL